jgi:hypothetical protein
MLKEVAEAATARPDKMWVLTVCIYGMLGDRDERDWGVRRADQRFKNIVAEYGGQFEYCRKLQQRRRDEREYGPKYLLEARFPRPLPEEFYKQVSEAGFCLLSRKN